MSYHSLICVGAPVLRLVRGSGRLPRLLALQRRDLVLQLQDLVFVVLIRLLDIILVLLLHTLFHVVLILQVTRLLSQFLNV